MFKVPESQIPETQLWYEFELGEDDDGKPLQHKVRRLKYLTVGQQEVVHGTASTSSTLLVAIFGPVGSDLGDRVRALEDDQFDALYEAWVADSEVKPGESKDS